MTLRLSVRSVGFAVFAVGILLVSAYGIRSSAGAPAAPAPAGSGLGKYVAMQHVVIVLMENHAYDNYFGTYCQAISSICPVVATGIPPGTCVLKDPNMTKLGCVKPFNFTAAQMVTIDPPHFWSNSQKAYDGGKMDGFYRAEGNTSTIFGHYNGTTLPVYWDVAQKFGLADHFFSSTLSYSLPNHWYMVAGTAPSLIYQGVPTLNMNITQKHAYLDQANTTQTVEQELNAHPNVSWRYYDWSLLNYSNAINTPRGPGSAYNLWSPLAAKNQSYTQAQHFSPVPTFFSDLGNRTLPNVSWVVPGPNYSDHPMANLTRGENFVSSILNSVGQSQYWNNTAVFVVWDDYGGFYDHVAPPSLDAYGLSFRVPVLIVSPWTPAGLITHHTLEFESLLHLIEWRWGLGCLTTRDCTATIPLGMFNMSLHRSPVVFANATTAKYPYVTPPKFARPYVEPPSTFAPEPENATVAD